MTDRMTDEPEQSLLKTLRRMPGPEADEHAIARWIDSAVAALDATPEVKRWRYYANGRRYLPEILAEHAPRHYRLDLWIPVGEQRLVNDAAAARQMAVRNYARAALATVVCACDGYSPDQVPLLSQHGLITPRR
jgi:hypothetical protein